MADVTITYDEVDRTGGLSVDKVTVHLEEGGTEEQLHIWCQYYFLNDSAKVATLGQKKCVRRVAWDDVPAGIKSALVTLDAYMQTAMDEDAGLL